MSSEETTELDEDDEYMGAEEFIDLLMSTALLNAEEKALQLPKLKDCFVRGMEYMDGSLKKELESRSFEELWNHIEVGRLSEYVISTVARRGVLDAWLDICPDAVKITDNENDDHE